MLAVWVCLAIAVLVPAAAGGRLLGRVLHFFRTLRRFRREFASGLTELGETAERLGAPGDAATRLEPALGRLRRSLAQLNVLLAAVDEVRDSWARVAAVYPRK